MPAFNRFRQLYANTAQAVVKNTTSLAGVYTVNFCNTGSTSAQIRLAVSSSQSAPNSGEWIEWNTLLTASNSYERTGILLNSGDYLIAYSSSASVVVQSWGFAQEPVSLVDDIVVAQQPGSITGRVVGVVGQFINVKLAGQTAVSSLSTWTNATSTPSQVGQWTLLASSGTLAMAVDSNTGYVAISSDGLTWTLATSLPAFNPATVNLVWSGLAYGAGTWVCTAGGINAASTQVAYSTNNGTSWTSINPLTSDRNGSLKYANGVFFSYNISVPMTATNSVNGITWTRGSTATTGTAFGSAYQVVYAAGSINAWYILREGNNQIQTQSSTNNGSTWGSTASVTATGMSLANTGFFAWGNGRFVALAQNINASWTSTDAVTWTTTSTPFSSNNYTYWSSLVFTNGYFIATSQQFSTFLFSIWFSSDGASWTLVTTSGSNQITTTVGLNS
jgi:hypothetical protein